MFQSASEEAESFLFDPMQNTGSSPEVSESEDVDRTAHKRKLDKDGFVHPATPDIPKTSMQYGLPSFHTGIEDLDFSTAKAIREENELNMNNKKKNESKSPLDQNTSHTDESEYSEVQIIQHSNFAQVEHPQQSDYLEDQNNKNMHDCMDSNAEHSSYLENQPIQNSGYSDKHNAKHSQYSGDPDAVDQKSNDTEFSKDQTTEHDLPENNNEGRKRSRETEPLTTLTDLFKELSQEAKTVTLQFSEAFVQSENYETFCMTRLDQLIAHAQDLEQVYLKQKEILRQRLRVISHTLQNI